MAVYVVLHRHIHIGSHQYKVRANGGLETINIEEGMVKKEKREKTNRKEMGKHHTWGGKKKREHSFHGNREGNGFGGCM